MTFITDISAREITDSRRKPTLEVTVSAGAAQGVFAVPSGLSTGSNEAHELRDADGSMRTACTRISEIKDALIGVHVEEQRAIDERLIKIDGTTHKDHLGGNTMIGVSIACAKVAARAQNLEPHEYLKRLETIKRSRDVPYLYMNYINGGVHAKSPIAFQEHILVPDTSSVSEAVSMVVEISALLAAHINERYGKAAESMGDEGGYVCQESDYHAPFALLRDAIHSAGYDGRVRIATDVAASSFFKNGKYSMGGVAYSPDELSKILTELADTYALLSIEDPFTEEAFDDFAKLQAVVESKLVGDDLTVTNESRLMHAIEKKAVRAVIIKPNQIGTLSETLHTMKLARENDIDCIVSHRSGETNDDFIADLAYAFGVFALKAGSLRQPERRVKYERLERISNT